jgi:MinD superfamily P-loop ATPase
VGNSWAFLQVIEERCTLCGLCLSACRQGALEVGTTKAYLAEPESCGGCGECENVCPEDAIHCAFEIVWGEDDMQQSATQGGPCE